MSRPFRLAVALITAAALAGCAAQTVMLRPKPVPIGPREAPQGHAWSLWVAEARDVRPPDKAGPIVGTFYTRFLKSPQTVYVEPNPEVYVKEQLTRYLLARGWEASGPERARSVLRLEIEEFGLDEAPGAVWDTVNLRVAYSVRISDASGREIGRLRLEGGSQVRSPIDTPRQVENGFRDAVADTFDALTRSGAFQRAVGASGP
ncbi:MAG: hypothetical protein HZB55_21610 [Deltaproteobacteria bacterium]|nr:hypothetical protein [Deltaproteobacteria bacterium]